NNLKNSGENRPCEINKLCDLFAGSGLTSFVWGGQASPLFDSNRFNTAIHSAVMTSALSDHSTGNSASVKK
ncbi:MAG: hypothetical protein WB561_00665, partial [Terracidiphilus sp.]